MKKITFLLALSACLASFAQKRTDIEDVKYRRSSLHRIVIEGLSFPKRGVIMQASKDSPFPDKYNNHTLPGFDLIELDSATAAIVSQDSSNTEISPAGAGLLAIKSIFKINPQGKKTDTLIDKKVSAYMIENEIAKKLVAKWYQRDPESGAFKMDLIGERGYYNASEMEAEIAAGTARGAASLADAGEQLINNTFVTVTTMDIINNEPLANAAKAVADELAASLNEPAKTIANTAISVGYNVMKEGYTIFTKAYLYQLNWNEEIAATFYNDMWIDASNPDEARKKVFDDTDLFSLKLVGTSTANNIVTAIGKIDESDTTSTSDLSALSNDELLLRKATIRNIDKVYSKLQKDYEIFQIKVPLLSVDPITAKIGTKEGLKGGEKFAVLEQYVDENGRTQFRNRGTLKVDKKQIWNNLFTSTNETVLDGVDENGLSATVFKGKGKFYPGMLIRQLK